MRALVTGGGGFLGSALVRALCARGDGVRILARGDYPDLAKLGAEGMRGDITDRTSVNRACTEVDVVFHTAAKAGGWGPDAEYEAINVEGSRHVVEAARAAGVRAVVVTSSPSVVHAKHDIEGGDESLPYSTHFLAAYPRTKARGEELSLAASTAAMPIVALRPHFIWGPGDRHLLPRLVKRSRAGRLRRIGPKDVRVDTTYIDNCVDAHLLAADRLVSGQLKGGKPYFISDGAPVGVWEMADRMLAAAGAPPSGRAVQVGVAAAVGGALEMFHRAFGLEREPAITRFAVSELSHSQWFDISAARRDLGYAPRVSIEEGLRRLAASLQRS